MTIDAHAAGGSSPPSLQSLGGEDREQRKGSRREEEDKRGELEEVEFWMLVVIWVIGEIMMGLILKIWALVVKISDGYSNSDENEEEGYNDKDESESDYEEEEEDVSESESIKEREKRVIVVMSMVWWMRMLVFWVIWVTVKVHLEEGENRYNTNLMSINVKVQQLPNE